MTKSFEGMAYNVVGAQGPWVMFSHSLGCSSRMWQNQARELANSHRVLVYDLPGHGRSEDPSDTGSVVSLAKDVVRLLDHLKIDSMHFVGLSIGGMIGQVLAISSPERLKSLVISNAGYQTRQQDRSIWLDRIEVARAGGMRSLAETAMGRWFPAEFRQREPQLVADLVHQFSLTSVAGYAYCCEAILGFDAASDLKRIQVPTLIVAGERDVAVTADTVKRMCEDIPNATLKVLEGAGHLSNLDCAAHFTHGLKTFLSKSVDETTAT